MNEYQIQLITVGNDLLHSYTVWNVMDWLDCVHHEYQTLPVDTIFHNLAEDLKHKLYKKIKHTLK